MYKTNPQESKSDVLGILLFLLICSLLLLPAVILLLLGNS